MNVQAELFLMTQASGVWANRWHSAETGVRVYRVGVLSPFESSYRDNSLELWKLTNSKFSYMIIIRIERVQPVTRSEAAPRVTRVGPGGLKTLLIWSLPF